MKILTTGKGGKAGSWEVRGVQLGSRVGDVIPRASVSDMRKYDVVVAVKRLSPGLIGELQRSGIPWIWDLVDFYPQPTCTKWDRSQAIKWARHQIQSASPDSVIYPNDRMAQDIGIPGTVVYHHARPALHVRPVKHKVEVVGYEGDRRYLGPWRKYIQRECRARGWVFEEGLTPDNYDIVVAFRGPDFGGYTQRNWKSNVKLANAQGAGVPFVGQPDPGYLETSVFGCEHWVDTVPQLTLSFDRLTPYETRRDIQVRSWKGRVTLAQCAEEVRRHAGLLIP